MLIGNRLGPYEILAKIGEGGMGEVYRARDPRVDRTVAIKFVSAEFRGRFEREGRAIAALNHPNVCQLYDVGPDYLVMEFVEGAPVGPVESMRKLLDLATQIADGLAAAHAAGVIHRDLKPANILVTGERSEHPHRVKILDFGVASMRGSGEADAAHQTRLQEQTSAGTILGTVGYMSPEQARGTAALTAQSDQFSLGIVLTELATGKHPFMRDSAPETLTAIIREDPPPLPAHVPAPLRWVIERLLAKDPSGRYDSTRDLHRELQQLRDRISEISHATTATGAPTHAQPAGQATPKKGASLKIRWIVAATAAVALTAGWAISGWLSSRTTDVNPIDRPLMRVSVELQQFEYARPTFAISPDGAHVAFLAQDAPGRHLAIQSLSRPEPTVVQGSEDADRRWIVSPGGGDFPVWSRTGQLFYTTTFAPQRRSVGVRHKVDGDTFVAEKPTLWSPAEYMDLDLFRNVDMSPDGQRFVVASETGADIVTSARSHLTLLLNFGDEIRRRLP